MFINLSNWSSARRFLCLVFILFWHENPLSHDAEFSGMTSAIWANVAKSGKSSECVFRRNSRNSRNFFSLCRFMKCLKGKKSCKHLCRQICSPTGANASRRWFKASWPWLPISVCWSGSRFGFKTTSNDFKFFCASSGNLFSKFCSKLSIRLPAINWINF